MHAIDTEAIATVAPADSRPGDRWTWRHVGEDHWEEGRVMSIDHDEFRAVVWTSHGRIVAVDYLSLADLDCWRMLSPRRRAQ